MPHMRIRKWIYGTLGGLFFALGVAGAFLPVLPTTPFMLLALWAFSHSSERLHGYLWNHPRFGASVRAWKQHGAVSAKAKASAIIVMTLSAFFLIFFLTLPLYATIPALSLMAFGAVYVLTRPTLR